MLEFEHTLFQLLLLIGVLNARPPQQKFTPYIVAGGLLLVFLPPVVQPAIPWDLLLGLTVPLLLWQNGCRLINADWQGKWKGIILWGAAALLIALALVLLNTLDFAGALLFGLIAASAIWRASETVQYASIISQIGPLTLVFLLSEVEPFVATPTHYMGGFLGGLAYGALTAAVAVSISLKVDLPIRKWIALGQIYVAYGLALVLGASPIGAALASVLVYLGLGMTRDLWCAQKVGPAPLNTWPGFGLMLGLFLFLGWQSHQPLSGIVVLEVILGCLAGILIAWLGKLWQLPPFVSSGSVWQAGLRVSLWLFPALLIWPRSIIRQPVYLAYAFGLALVILIASRMSLTYFKENK